MRIILLTLLLLIFVQFIYSQDRDFNGIKFNSQNVERSEKTSIFLNEGKPIELTNSFSISFDISFWDYKKYGPIFRITDEQGNEIRVVYIQFQNSDTSYIQIIEPSHKNIINVTLAKKDLLRNKWFNLKLLLSRKTQQLKAYWNNRFIDDVPYSSSNQENFSFVFGIKEIKNPLDFDVPAISVKNIIISENEKQKYFWELNPFKENPLVDKISGSKLKALNPVWVCQDHQRWNHITDYKISETSIASLGVAFDSLKSRLFIDGRDSLIIYNLISGRDSIIEYKTESPAYWTDLFYDEENQRLYSFFTGIGNVSIYDLKKNEWIFKDTSKIKDGYNFGGTKFSYPKSSDLYFLGGYGWYKTKNDLLKYDFVKKDWQKIKLKKNEMTPRAWFTFGKAFKDGEYFIYGGTGNESGEQEKGFKSYNDLFLLNMNDSTITKLKLPEQNNYSYGFLFNNLYLDKKDSSFYFLSQNEEGKGIYISLNKLDLKTGKAILVANKFWGRSAYKWMYSYLHYNKSTNEFISVIFDSTTVELFSINYPPISESEKTYLEETNSNNNSALILFASAGIGLVVMFFFYARKKKTNHSLFVKISADNNLGIEAGKAAILNSINLFGGFHIYDNQSRDIISEFSPKLKEILLLILLRSFNHYQHKGITSEELSSIIWPDSSPESVKTNRGVAINKIRKLLSNVEGVDLQFSDRLWVVKMNSGSSSDYADYLKCCDASKKANGFESNLIDSLINIVDGGEFLKGISYEWLDSIKFAVNNEIINSLKLFFDDQEIQNNAEKLIQLCDVILMFDSVDQDAVKLKIKTLSNTGKLHIAKNAYSLVVAEYKRLYDEQYPISFEEIIKS